MTSATMDQPNSSPSSAGPTPVNFVCAEVWGGNRPINRPVEAPGVRGKLFSQPCGGDSGGDVHYMSVCGSGLLTRWCVADVAGHGEQVAGISRELHALLRRYKNTLDHRRMLTDLNRTLESADDPVMTTAAAFTYYPPSGNLSFSYAGHPPAWVFDRVAGRWERLDLAAADEAGPGGGAASGGAGIGTTGVGSAGTAGARRLRRPPANMPLSVDRDTDFSRGKRRMRVGDRLLVLTDGVLEAPSPAGELFGDERVQQLLDQNDSTPVVSLADRLLDALVEFTGDSRLDHDDVTFLALEIVEGPPGPAIWNAIRNRIFHRRGNSAELEAAGDV